MARALPPHGRGRRFDSCIAHCDGVAEWLGAGLQSLIRGFDSRRRLWEYAAHRAGRKSPA